MPRERKRANLAWPFPRRAGCFPCTGGTVSLDGQRATVVLDAAIHSDEGGDAQIVRESVSLVRQNDNWCMALTTLESLMIRD